MKRWKQYEQYLQTGDWHVHTNYTDGENSILENCEKAVENKLELIAFTEHIRRENFYDYSEFASEINSVRDKFELKILCGCEAKVINLNGDIDVSSRDLEKCEIVLGSFHGNPFDNIDDYLIALKNMLQNKEVDIWAHPTLYAQEMGFVLEDDIIKEICRLCLDNDVLIEKNKRHAVPDENFIKIATELNCTFVRGSDAHSTDELSKET